MPSIELRDIDLRVTEPNGRERVIFSGMDFVPGADERSVAILGRSGSGKSTLLRVLAGIKLEYGGTYRYGGGTLDRRSAPMADFRRKTLGFVTQSPTLLPDRNVLQNVLIGHPRRAAARASECLEWVGLTGFERTRVDRLSGGEAQRVAIARALFSGPELLLADEPTGALDAETETQILRLFERVVESGCRVILATHSERVAEWCDARRTIRDGRLIT